MGRIAVIRALAFISSIIGRVIALPFVVLFHIARFVVRGIRELRRISLEKKADKRKRKREQKELRQKRREEKRQKRKEEALKKKEYKEKRKEEILEQKKLRKEQKQLRKEQKKLRKEQKLLESEQRKLIKEQKRKEAVERRKAKQENKRLLKEEKLKIRQARLHDKVVEREAKRKKREEEQIARIKRWEASWTERFANSSLKGNNSLWAVIFRKIYWGCHWILQKGYWGSHWLFRKIYWGCHWILQKGYWGCHWVYRKVYWGCRWILQKGYWGCHWVYRKVYWGCRWVLQKGYWGCHWLFRKVYWGCHWLFRKLYWGCRYIVQKGYWVCHGIWQKVYWKCRIFVEKIYWKVRTLYQKCYWKVRTIFEKIYWKIHGWFNKVYWKLRGYYNKVYWVYYAKSRQLYNALTKNEYMDLFFVFLRGYLKKGGMQTQCLAIIGVKEYFEKQKSISEYQVIEAGTERVVCLPDFFEKSEEQIEKYNSPDIYVASIENVDLIGASNVIIANDKLLNDAVSDDKEQRIDIRYSAIKKVINKVAVIEDYDVEAVFEKGIYLVGAASFNYYHLVVEILSRLTFVDYLEEYREYPILVDEVVMRIPQFKSALDCINRYNHPIIVVEKEKKYHVEKLVLPSSNVWMPTNLYNRNDIRVDDFLIADSVLHNIRNAVGVWEEREPWRKIFISRKNTQAVRLSNETKVRQIFAENGFEIVYTEEMTFRQQIECFGQAKCIVATSGAALTNTIFCQKSAIIGCIIPSEHRFYMYSTIAYLLGLKPLFLDAKITDKTAYAAADTFVLDEGYVKRYAKRINNMLK